MGTTKLTHFDYLAEHDTDLESALGLSNLSKDINHWRCYGMEYPDGALVGSRKIVETALKTLAKIFQPMITWASAKQSTMQKMRA